MHCNFFLIKYKKENLRYKNIKNYCTFIFLNSIYKFISCILSTKYENYIKILSQFLFISIMYITI